VDCSERGANANHVFDRGDTATFVPAVVGFASAHGTVRPALTDPLNASIADVLEAGSSAPFRSPGPSGAASVPGWSPASAGLARGLANTPAVVDASVAGTVFTRVNTALGPIARGK
jgi:hypothetical protein